MNRTGLVRPRAKEFPVADTLEPDLIHRFKNKVAVAEGFCRLLIEDLEPGDVRREDAQRIYEALQQMQAMLPALQAELTQGRPGRE